MKTLLSPKDVAIAIGASESSLKRWADAGRLRVARTTGGHRRIALHEAIRFIREGRFAVLRPDALGLRSLGRVQPTEAQLDSEDSGERLFRHLVDGNGSEARALVTSLYLSGASIASISDGPVRHAMARIGELWKHSEEGIFIEHRATDVCIQVVNVLRIMVGDDQAGATAVGCAIQGDPYLLPSVLAATVIASEGMRAINLGPETPPESLALATKHHRAALVWISISALSDDAAQRPACGALLGALGEQGIDLVVGGRRHHELELPSGRRVHRLSTMSELAAFVRGRVSAAAAGTGEVDEIS